MTPLPRMSIRQLRIGSDGAALVGSPVPGLVIAAAGADDERRRPVTIERIRENALVGRVHIDDDDPGALGLQPERRLLAEPVHELPAARQAKSLVALDCRLLAAHREDGDAVLGIAGLPLGEEPLTHRQPRRSRLRSKASTSSSR